MAKKSKSKIKIGKDGIYDARQLGTGKMVVLGFQHMFAMFGMRASALHVQVSCIWLLPPSLKSLALTRL